MIKLLINEKMDIMNNNNFVDAFIINFEQFKKHNIVIYGIGVKTQEIISNVNYNFIGLMDKDPSNTGKKYYNLEVLSTDKVIKTADIIIIVASDVYFQTIFSRIKLLKNKYNIPIYFCNGEEAKSYEKEEIIEDNEYWNNSLQLLKKNIDKNEIISFDLYDTLITRKLTEPTDLFYIIQRKLDIDDFVKSRIESELYLGNSASLENIYKNMPKEYCKGLILERELELSLILKRDEVVEAFNYAVENKKEVYIITDIYHKKEFIEKILDYMGIKGYRELFISCEIGKRKSDKTLWEYYKTVINNKKALHIGDNIKSDIENVKEFDINTFHIYSPYDMLKHSTLKNIIPKICTVDESIIIGSIIAKVFNSPFCLSDTKGTPFFNSLEDLGYVFYGPYLFNYITWIIKENIKNKHDLTFFVARDGYFLQKIYELIVHKLNLEAPPSEYLMISRVLATIISIDTVKDFDEILKIRFQGTMKDLFKIRFGIDIENHELINTSTDIIKIKKIINANKDAILENAKKQQVRYLKYLEALMLNNKNISIVDPSYKGTIQFYLSKIISKNISVKGYYCNADLSKSNKYYINNNMVALYQKSKDEKAEKSNLRKNTIFYEDGMLVAPEGTCLSINQDLSFDFSPIGNTQKNFNKKEQIFLSIVNFIEDVMLCYNSIDEIELSNELIDFTIGEICSEKTLIQQDIKDTFYYDSIFEQVIEGKIFD